MSRHNASPRTRTPSTPGLVASATSPMRSPRRTRQKSFNSHLARPPFRGGGSRAKIRDFRFAAARQGSLGRLAQLARAPARQAGGHRFEPCIAHWFAASSRGARLNRRGHADGSLSAVFFSIIGVHLWVPRSQARVGGSKVARSDGCAPRSAIARSSRVPQGHYRLGSRFQWSVPPSLLRRCGLDAALDWSPKRPVRTRSEPLPLAGAPHSDRRNRTAFAASASGCRECRRSIVAQPR